MAASGVGNKNSVSGRTKVENDAVPVSLFLRESLDVVLRRQGHLVRASAQSTRYSVTEAAEAEQLDEKWIVCHLGPNRIAGYSSAMGTH